MSDGKKLQEGTDKEEVKRKRLGKWNEKDGIGYSVVEYLMY